MDGLGRAIGGFINVCIVMLVIFVPLGMWKLVDIIIWMCHHFSVTIN